MSIDDIERSKKLREYGELLGREGVSERVVQICEEIVANQCVNHIRRLK